MSQELDSVVNALELSEDAALQLKTIFEAAISEKATQLEEAATEKAEAFYSAKADEYAALLKEEYETKGMELVEDYKKKVSDLETQADAFLTESVKEWIAENKVAVVSSLKAQRMETLIAGMKTLFEENSIEIPESDINLAEEKDKEIAKLVEGNDVLTARLKTVVAESQSLAREIAFMKSTNGLSDSQAEKLQTLAKDIQAESVEDYTKKLEFLKESFLKSNDNVVENITEEHKEVKNFKKAKSLDESIMEVLAKNNKKA